MKALLSNTRGQLANVESLAANYLKQMSYALNIQDTAWADGIVLGFKTFHSWWNDPARTVDLNEVVIVNIPYSDEALEQIKSLGQEEMLDAAWIKEFNYHQVGLPGDSEFNFIEAFVEATPAETARVKDTLIEAIPNKTIPAVNPEGKNV
jgi:hypothetical protein